MPVRLAVCLALLALHGCAHTPPDDPSDPLEPVNRAVYGFNETADRWVLRPVAKGYDWVMPDWGRARVRDFFGNLFYPTVLANDLLQLKLEAAALDVARLVLNSTFGLAGLFDVATPLGLPANNEDFGQTLGYWGVGPGWYLMLPLLGPSDNRDLIGRAGDAGTDPTSYIGSWTGLGMAALDTIEDRAQFLGADRMLEQQIDRYVFVRTFYLQRRLDLVYDGSPPLEDFGFDEEEEAEPAPDGSGVEPTGGP